MGGVLGIFGQCVSAIRPLEREATDRNARWSCSSRDVVAGGGRAIQYRRGDVDRPPTAASTTAAIAAFSSVTTPSAVPTVATGIVERF